MSENVQATETATDDTNASEQATTETTEDTTNDSQETTETKTETEPIAYKLDDMPEGMSIADEAKTSLFEIAKKHGLKNEALNDFVKEHIKSVTANTDAQAEAALRQWETTQNQWDGELKKDWGENFEANKSMMDKVVTRFITDPKLKEYMFGIPEEGKVNAVHPLLAKALLEIGKVMSPDTLETGQPQTKANKGLKDMFSDLNTQHKT